MSLPARPSPSEEAGEIARLLSYIGLLTISAGLFLEAVRIPTSRFEALGAGAFPMLVHAVLMLLLLSAIAGSIRTLPSEAYARFAGQVRDWARARRLVFVVFACLGLYLFAMPIAGYPIATLAFLAVLQTTLAPKTRGAMAVALVVSVLFSFGLNWLFAEVFNVFLPRGG
ncbi:hypothetical protein OCH239_07185 [Roseivivax halodurans JCM 10272]|uniref:DUF1468 domain-containing protein n=1 Tax=Roseivivax halodurans JCM 10272 TaxID=1449350 RepID=X7ECY3_9RHOB|nr:tripartite tricarboxylate transporter TctB family protein [Roseivivax halodurans]ETX13745.1 hypothetical protein OCH239_07185 [Roseivivax halodurans JCM 10272]